MGHHGLVTDRPVILFDGVCNLCNASVTFIIRRDAWEVFRFAPLQSETGKKLLEKAMGGVGSGFAGGGGMDTMVLVEGGRVFTRSTAALKIARRLSGLWPALYLFILVPRPIRDVVYRFIARNRYRWWGRRDTCMVPTPEVKGRFLS